MKHLKKLKIPHWDISQSSNCRGASPLQRRSHKKEKESGEKAK